MIDSIQTDTGTLYNNIPGEYLNELLAELNWPTHTKGLNEGYLWWVLVP